MQAVNRISAPGGRASVSHEAHPACLLVPEHGHPLREEGLAPVGGRSPDADKQ